MLLKWLFTGAIVYLLYKYFFGPNALGSGRAEQRRDQVHQETPSQQKPTVREEDEYIDYEEVD